MYKPSVRMKTYGFLLVLFISATASAQEFKPFKLNISIGYAQPDGKGGKGGFAYSIEPKYGVGDHLDIGIRLEQAFLAQSITTVGNNTRADVKALTSGLLTATYLLGTGSIRPFVGVGGGVYNIGETDVAFTTTSGGTVAITDRYYIASANKFGGMVRAGIKAGHLTLAAEYNALASSSSNKSLSTVVERKDSYVGFKVGIDLGGGRR